MVTLVGHKTKYPKDVAALYVKPGCMVKRGGRGRVCIRVKVHYSEAGGMTEGEGRKLKTYRICLYLDVSRSF